MADTFTKKQENFIFSPKGLPYIFLGKNWEGRVVYHPQIIEKDGQYYLFYTGTTSAKAICFRHDIGLAISSDLKEWQRHKGNPVLSPGKTGAWDSDLVAHSFIIKKDDLYYMFYDGSPKGEWSEVIGLATSADLLNWQKHENSPVLQGKDSWWDKNHVSRCGVFWENGLYYMFFAGHDGLVERIGLATSPDLLYWQKQSPEPVLDLGTKGEWDEQHISDPRVIKFNDIFLMFYTGYDKKGKGRLGLAYSQDLLRWQRFKQNPIMGIGQPGDWDQDEACRADIFQDKEQYFIIYSGRKGSKFRIGLAQLDLPKILSQIHV
ncbi:MAG: hypothetical protein AAB723_01160 [Patescibacteria group bacterium]